MKEKINFILHNLKNMFFYKKMKIFILIETKLYESRKKKNLFCMSERPSIDSMESSLTTDQNNTSRRSVTLNEE